MKRLLTLFSAFVLGSGSSFGVVSCTTRTKHDLEEDELDRNQDLEILNQIKKKAKQTLSRWFETKARIDINDYPDLILSFKEIVAKLKSTNNDGLILTSEIISKYRFLNQLLVGFKAEFDNLNQSLLERYSNYYFDSMPLLLAKNNISFTLYNINFDKIAKLVEDTPQEIMGIRMNLKIAYEIRFKKLPSSDVTDYVGIISNNFDYLSNIQDNIEKYFTDFVNHVFKKQNYQIILPQYRYFWKEDLITDIIKEALKNKNILFNGSLGARLKNGFGFSDGHQFQKHESVLKWAGEGYHPSKLTQENFSKFYKETYISNHIKEYKDYYLVQKVTYITLWNFGIENLRFKKHQTTLNIEPINILVAKNTFDSQFNEFTKMIMDFWHCFKLETYYEDYRLVFKLNQEIFDKVLKNARFLELEDPFRWKRKTIPFIFEPIFSFFQTTLNSKDKKFAWNSFDGYSLFSTVNLINKTEKSFTVKFLRDIDQRYSMDDDGVNFIVFLFSLVLKNNPLRVRIRL
ncbi:hypothetical protein [Spiroplasma melliferum]|uniref:Lipoprotein n=2 Tax=Spiroplasma melliferum TaxID=2134 RepID=A0AAI9T3A6_SPIME|nr:hypothetical protein [Spiroplasma melliferum]KAI92676.1 hypothetical protein SPM_001140 [Spiroplasma melliferum KC3]QCO24286.1 hypothetical protein SRED_002775 [Spiroplasma melliferum]